MASPAGVAKFRASLWRSSAFIGGATGFALEKTTKCDEPATPVKNYITRSGLERLQDEHRFLLTRDPAVTEVVTWASNGNRSENAAVVLGIHAARALGAIRALHSFLTRPALSRHSFTILGAPP
jgi:hypothetical protein